ncbi:MAG: peptidoglycan editing factor PgeF [Roseburia sp.]|nr:peptidoglycan editing factor PgeF [Roseburia sp.]
MDFVRKNEGKMPELRRYPLEAGELPLLEYPLFDGSGVRHGFSTREGGVSGGEFSSLNFSFTRGDDPAAVRENFKRIAEVFGCGLCDIVCSDQTHTTNVLRVDKSFGGAGVTGEKPYRAVDGLITNARGLLLATFYADCVPLFFVDPVHHAIGLSHSGWRGTVGRMGAATLHAMHREFETEPKDVLAAIGPSICQDCYEVGEDVAGEFIRAFPDWESRILVSRGGGKYQLDLWRCNELILREAGVRAEHLAVTSICTCCNPGLLFSHRASHGRRGNLGAFLMLV